MLRSGLVVAVVVLLAGCSGDQGGEGWIKAKRALASATAGGVAFTIQVPEGFKKGGDDKYPDWKNEGDTVSFQVNAPEQKVATVEEAIAKISLPDDQYIYEKKETLPDGVIIRRTSEPNGGVAFVDVFRSGPSGNLQCHGSAQAGGRNFENLPGTLAALEEVCLSMALK